MIRYGVLSDCLVFEFLKVSFFYAQQFPYKEQIFGWFYLWDFFMLLCDSHLYLVSFVLYTY